MKYFFSLLTLALVLVMHTMTAFAADAAAVIGDIVPAAHEIAIQSPLQSLVTLVFGAISGAALAIVTWAFGKKGKVIKLDDEHKAYLDNAIIAGVRAAENKVNTLLTNVKDPTVKIEMVADAVNFVLGSVPGLLQKYEVSPATVRAYVQAEIEKRAGLADEAPAGDA